MKKFVITLSAIAMTLGAVSHADARDHGGGNRYPTTVVVTGADKHGRPIYAERYFIRLNSHGKPMWGYRPLPGKGGGHDGGGHHHRRR
jgi:hypothetical protein